MQTDTIKTTLFLLPGGRELALPEHTDNFKNAMQQAVAERTAHIMMLADTPLIPEDELHTLAKYKNVFLIESDEIITEDDAWRVAYEMQAQHFLPNIVTSGFDFQVIQMQPVRVKYEDFEIVDKYV